MKLHLIRHGKSQRHSIGVWGRTFDSPLDPDFHPLMDQAKVAFSSIGEIDVFSSPLSRCLESLGYILPREARIIVVEELRAYHSGQFEDKTDAFMQANHSAYCNLSFADRFSAPQFGEESIVDQTRRVRRGFATLLDLATCDDAVLCTHYSVINIVANIVTGNSNVTTYGDGIFDVAEGACLTFTFDEDAVRNELKT